MYKIGPELQKMTVKHRFNLGLGLLSLALASRKAKVKGNFGYYSNKLEVLDYDIIDLNLLFKELEVISCMQKLSP